MPGVDSRFRGNDNEPGLKLFNARGMVLIAVNVGGDHLARRDHWPTTEIVAAAIFDANRTAVEIDG